MDNNTNAGPAVASTGLLACPFCGMRPVWERGMSGERWEHPDSKECSLDGCFLEGCIIGATELDMRKWNARHANNDLRRGPPSPPKDGSP